MHHNGRQDLLSKPVAPICEQINYRSLTREREKARQLRPHTYANVEVKSELSYNLDRCAPRSAFALWLPTLPLAAT